MLNAAGAEVDPGLRHDDVVLSEDGSTIFRSEESAWGAVVSFERRGGQSNDDDHVASTGGRERDPQWVVDVLVNCSPKAAPGEHTCRSPCICKCCKLKARV